MGKFLPSLAVDDSRVLFSFFPEVEWACCAVGPDVDGVGVQREFRWLSLDATPGFARLHHDDWSKVILRAQLVKF